MISALCATCGHRIYSVGLARWAHAMTPEHEHEATPIREPVVKHECSNCGQPIWCAYTYATGAVWVHGNRHTVCDWEPSMAPTSRVATPA